MDMLDMFQVYMRPSAQNPSVTGTVMCMAESSCFVHVAAVAKADQEKERQRKEKDGQHGISDSRPEALHDRACRPQSRRKREKRRRTRSARKRRIATKGGFKVIDLRWFGCLLN